MLDVTLVRKRHASYPEIFKAINRNFLPKAGISVQAEAIRLAPVDQGRLKGSIRYKVSADHVSVGTNVEYAAYQEYGTYKMRGTPFLRPALDNKRRFLVALWADIYEKVFRIMGPR
jgi:HK97 gp10 family phage protein